MELQERDVQLLREVSRWRFMLGRHIKALIDFPSQATATRRIKMLVDGKYLKKEMLLYGVPPVYTVAHKGRMIIGANKRGDKVNLSLLQHDVAVLDLAVCYVTKKGVQLSSITTEKELHISDGFSTRRHRPDFIIDENGEKTAVEVELSLKAVERIQNNMRDNFLEYDQQFWFVGNANSKIAKIIKTEGDKYIGVKVYKLPDGIIK